MTATTDTVAHDSATCTLGADGGRCEMCVWANRQQIAGTQAYRDYIASVEQPASRLHRIIQPSDPHSHDEDQLCGICDGGLAICADCGKAENELDEPCISTASTIEQSTAAIHARRRALLERAAPDAPTDGAVALAEAHLRTEDWWSNVPTNGQEDEWVMELAGRIQRLINDYLGAARKACQREQRRLREDG